MKEKDFQSSRRNVLRYIAAGAVAAPLSQLISTATAFADELPHVSESDPRAKGLKYVNDATKADRAEKAGVPGSEQFCNNCQFIQASEGEWRPCALFPGQAVNENGWCMSWFKKPA